RGSHLASLVVGLLAAGAVAGGACTYNTYIVQPTGAGGDGGGTSKSSGSTSSGSGGASAASSSSSGMCDGGMCDEDCDGEKSKACGGNDCADNDDRAHPGQSMFFPTPINGTTSYDFNCNGAKDYGITGVLLCDAVNCDQQTVKWLNVVPDC